VDGKVVQVTADSREVGLAIAEGFVTPGAQVAAGHLQKETL
jgi:NAD(P)-dependent dehydrogenase (short-subunit alcohol dehydrogenase family)